MNQSLTISVKAFYFGGMKMKKEDLIKLGLDDETAQKVADASAEELKGFVPIQSFNDVDAAKKQLEIDIKARDTQLESLKKLNPEQLQQTITDLQAANDQAKADYEAKLSQQSFSFALKEALTGAKVKNSKAVEALLDRDVIKLDGDKLLGLDEQLTKLKESDAYLFESEQQGTPPPSFSSGQYNPPGGNNEPQTLADALAQRFTGNNQ